MVVQIGSPAAGKQAVRLCVLDWDDTCCPSSWIAATPEANYDDPANLELLRSIESNVVLLFKAIEQVGCSVVIITNADDEWVRFSARRFLPRIAPLLARVRVVSARHYEGLYPGRSVCWKAAAFTHVGRAFFGGVEGGGTREIISIGDSNDERLAVRAAAAPLHATPKAIKLVDAPTLRTVAAQLRTVTTCLPFLVLSEHAIDVDVSAILNYMNLSSAAPSGGEADHTTQIWHEAAWGVLTAIRFQSLAHAQAHAGLQPQACAEPPRFEPASVVAGA
ncbi:hypothetical protein M885DRAFT_513397 [Pelagophyceae sp. CCMP2097]|nr:hypothetical protein M885DRAFT_513397 [Pelagophyceae sp. CCMP2097]